ncbi:MAG: murein biosynthesis integral membrane protein MurJ [Candidatus Shapirobacteria bacterium]
MSSFLLEKIKNFTQRKQSTILSASLVLAVTFGISALLGFLRSRFLYAHFFNCCVADLDVYNAAFRLPDLIFKLLVTGALSASFIPVYSSYLHKNKKTADRMASSVINLLLIIFSVASIIVIIFAHPLSQFIAHGFTPSQVDLMANLTRILLIAQIFFLVSNFLTGILQVNQIFIVSAISPIVYNIFIILGIFTLAPIFGIYGVVYGAVVGAFFHLAIQIPSIRRQGFKFSFIIKTKLKGVREVFKLMVPRSLALGLGEIENTVTLFFATTLAAGSLSLLNLAVQFMYLPSRIFGTTIGQASLPILSSNIAKNELESFKKTVSKIILQSLYIALPITVLILVNRLAIVRILFGSKEFPWAATLLTAKILAYLTPAIACQAVIQILIRAFYALHNTKTPFKISFISLFATVATSYYFINFTNLGVVSLAISASIGNLVQMFGLLYLFIKTVHGFDWAQMFSKFNRIFLSTLIMGFVSWLSIRFFDLFILDTTKTIYLMILFILSSLIGIITYIASSKLLNVDEYKDYLKYGVKIKNFFNKKK